MKNIVSLFCLFIGLSGCVSMKYVDLKLASNNEKFSQEALQGTELKPGLSGEDCVHQVILPLGSIPTVEEAIEDALSRAPGAVAIEKLQVRHTLLFALLYAKTCIKVSGNAVYSKK